MAEACKDERVAGMDDDTDEDGAEAEMLLTSGDS
jgi:hypothetical protein